MHSWVLFLSTQNHGRISPSNGAGGKVKISAPLSALMNVTSPSVQSTQTQILLGTRNEDRGVRGEVRASNFQSQFCNPQTPSSGVISNFPFFSTDFLATPKAQHEKPPTIPSTSTTQQCLPSVKPSRPSTQAQVVNLSGLMGLFS